jgi:Mce-associated membrane protein
MTRSTPRRPSRTTTPRPRKIAGQGGSGTPDAEAPESSTDPASEAHHEDEADSGAAPPPDEPTRTGRSDDDVGGGRPRGPLVAGVLIVLVATLALVLVGQVAWFVVDAVRDDDSAAVDDSTTGGEGGAIAAPAGRPVVLDQLAVQEGVDAAAHAATTMFARDWETYDQGVAEATELMTSEFAEEYGRTTDDVKQEFVAKKTKVEVQVVAQGVVRANDSELEALIFLNQYIFRGRGKDATTVVTPYRAVLTMVHTDRGWFVDDVQTK